MAIARMISKDVAEFRAFQTQMTEAGRIRLGVYATPEGKRGRPEKLDRFRLTAPDEALIRAVADEYGGTPNLWKPQGGGQPQWEVITTSNNLDVWIVNGQKIESDYEAWAGGRTCVRRCDGVWNSVMQSPCVCNDPQRRPPDKDMCKIITRVWVMLPKIQGVNSWRMESHGENFAVEVASIANFVATAPMPVPAALRLREETRRERNHDKGVFETKSFYVPWFHLWWLSPQMIAGSSEQLAQALVAAGAPAALSAGRRAEIEAAPTATPAATPATPAAPPAVLPAAPPAVQPPAQPAAAVVTPEEVARILAAIEGAPTLARLDGIKEGLARRGIRDKPIQDAWVSKRKAIEASERLRAEAERLAADPVDRAAINEVRTDLGMEPVSAFTDEPREYAVGDTVNVGGLEFTKISDDPFPPMDDSPLARAIRREQPTAESVVFEGEVEDGTGPGSGLPMVPDGNYNTTEQMSTVMVIAGQRNPPLTTDQVMAMVCAAFDLKLISEVTGLQLARIAEAMRQGIL